jgi:hypothetical protein
MTMVKDTRPLARDPGREATRAPGSGRAPQPGRAPTAPAGPKRDRPTPAWELFVGSIIALALLKEACHRIGGHPIAIRARKISLNDSAAGVVLLGDALHRIASRTAGVKDAGA